MMKKIYTTLVICMTMAHWSIGQNNIFVTAPAISPDGTTIAFSYQGDLWTMPLNEGNAQRLTIHEAYDGTPVWSPDGKNIAFTSNRFGNNDIFTTTANGGVPVRLTYRSSGDALSSWSDGGDILFASNRAYRQIEWDTELQKISQDGGTPQRLMNAFGQTPAISPNGRFIAFSRGACRISREAYKGPADKDIWIYDTQNDQYIAITNNDHQDHLPKWRGDNELLYLNASNGTYNIYKVAIDNTGKAGTSSPVTNFTSDGVRHFDVSNDGKIVYERDINLYTTSITGEISKKLAINISADYRFDPVEHKTYSNNVSEYEVSPNGKLDALVIHGEVFIKQHDKEKSRAINISKHAYRDQHVTWLNDSTVIFVSDRDGQKDLYLARSSDPNKTDIFKSLKHNIVRLTKTSDNESNPQASPDGKQLVFRRGRGKLVVADIDDKGKLNNERIMQDGWNSPSGVSWSPDSKWLAYSMQDLNFNSEIYIHDATNKNKPVNVSMHPRSDALPVWSPDGSKLGFISNRIDDNDVWFVWLQKEEWEKTKRDRDEGYYFETDENDEKKEDKNKGDKKKDKPKVEPVKIDFQDIHDRLTRVTSRPGGEWNLAISKDGETFYFTASNPLASRSDLYSAKWDGTEWKQITKGGKGPGGVTLSRDGKKLYYVSGGRLNELDPKSAKSTGLPHSAKMTIDHKKEREQVFEEAWASLNEGFYDPGFHGNNWDNLKKKYKPWAMAASSTQDFRYMFNVMLGQLNASHMGLFGPTPEDTQRERTGLLGLEVAPHKDGAVIKHIIPNTPADKTKSKLHVGEVITSVNGQQLDPKTNIYSLLVNEATNQVLLEIKNSSGQSREVVIRPVNSISTELYEEWIAEQQRLTEKYSNGRLGYIHIRGMNLTSFERFERELMASGLGKEGIVIDVRYNGGGWTTDYLMAVLNVRQHAYTVPRGAAKDLNRENKNFRQYYPFSERLPLSSWTKPSIALCNENSYSNAEIFSHAYKTLGIGTLVGKPTFGAVISTGGQGLMDGSFVRMPFRAWYVKATGENMEHGPAVPDILVDNAPDNRAKKEDSQLKKAVEVLLKQIEEGK
ncbi:S41 family peptidase [Fulvivirgaceae bacterium BMA10]|uniref:Tricorn protease homolog n=1 Tax=Splendidivirga corallicola TaxID=3051826 RepID=A0ABT8KXF2_9BACT|nr:S41 family peptidase [Fulvivirgaceae bacterium BMA10]